MNAINNISATAAIKAAAAPTCESSPQSEDRVRTATEQINAAIKNIKSDDMLKLQYAMQQIYIRLANPDADNSIDLKQPVQNGDQTEKFSFNDVISIFNRYDAKINGQLPQDYFNDNKGVISVLDAQMLAQTMAKLGNSLK